MGVPLTSAQYKVAFAITCTNISEYSRQAGELANTLADYPAGFPIPDIVQEVIRWDDLYLAELARRKYIQENRMIPPDEPQKEYQHEYKVPEVGMELGIALRNLSKNVSVWKKRVGDARYPDADQKLAMYTALYQEARENVRLERTRLEKLKNSDLK